MSSPILILVRSQYSHAPTCEAIREYHEAVWNELRDVDGFEDAFVWVDSGDTGKHLILYRYRDVASADAGLKVVAKERILRQSQRIQSQAADVTRVRVLKDYGTLRKNFADAELISISIRVAEPGYAKEMEDDLERVFEECKFIKGFSGYAIGINDVLEEEVIGLASWDTAEAFRSSLPDGIIANVASYQRAWQVTPA